MMVGRWGGEDDRDVTRLKTNLVLSRMSTRDTLNLNEYGRAESVDEKAVHSYAAIWSGQTIQYEQPSHPAERSLSKFLNRWSCKGKSDGKNRESRAK